MESKFFIWGFSSRNNAVEVLKPLKSHPFINYGASSEGKRGQVRECEGELVWGWQRCEFFSGTCELHLLCSLWFSNGPCEGFY